MKFLLIWPVMGENWVVLPFAFLSLNSYHSYPYSQNPKKSYINTYFSPIHYSLWTRKTIISPFWEVPKVPGKPHSHGLTLVFPLSFWFSSSNNQHRSSSTLSSTTNNSSHKKKKTSDNPQNRTLGPNQIKSSSLPHLES